MMIMNPGRKVTYAIFQSRIYHAHVPRKLVIGLNPIRRELKLSISRPEYNDPAMLLMHAQTVVLVKGNSVSGAVPELKELCPGCEQRVIVTNGNPKSRVFVDRTNEKGGYYNHGEYFDCEMDVASGNTRGRALMAFLPYNKNPKTLSNSISSGFRQIAAFVLLYPRVERCGVMSRLVQN
jgi:hypothetical protein